MKVFPPDIRIRYKGNVCANLRNVIKQLKQEAYQPFIREVNNLKNFHASVQLVNGQVEGKILNVCPEYICLISDSKEKIYVQIEQVDFIRFI
jgi:hypothetical protein